ncbi:MAG: methionine--tRNA ligase [Ignavibacteriaceae bacterium]|nr:methionine--tRNA ligase [Ignavibacteriaceae bacterium]
MNTEKIIVTAALPYANGAIHLGHLAGAYLPADIYVRFQRLRGKDIIFICGSDEHGVPITITADKEKVSPQVIIDRYHEINKISFEKFGMSFDIYGRTSSKVHHETAKEFFLNFYNQGLFSEKKTMQFYDNKANMFLPDRYVEGTCPNCNTDGARSDECENCGALYNPSELKNPISKISGEKPELKETSHWFIPLNKFQDRLQEYINDRNLRFNWKENVLQYCKGWFHDGLQERAITRDLDWGVKVPLENADHKVLYVWFEAVLGYISATKELFSHRGQDSSWREYWQGENTRYIAFIGKDNIVFHAIIFPAMLMAWNDGNKDKYILPENVPANEFLNFEGRKFSKSRNWGIDVLEFLNHFEADSLRYTLALNLPELRDSDFSWNDFQARHNNELADILGNFVNRTMTFVHKHFEGKVPQLGKLSERDVEMIDILNGYPVKIATLIEKYKLKDATLEVMNLARLSNKYFNDSEPWKTLKSDKEQCGTSLNISLQAIYTLAGLFLPVIPFTSQKIFRMVNSRPVEWENMGKSNLVEGHQLGEPVILFKKVENEMIEEIRLKTANAESDVKKEPESELITIDDFSKVQLRIAEILSAERVKKSDKLIKLIVDTGSGKRQVIAGIGKSYSPEELPGKKVVIVANLKPAKLMGEESQGMVLAVENEQGILNVVEVDSSISNGTKVK